jgi:hypothetical protein
VSTFDCNDEENAQNHVDSNLCIQGVGISSQLLDEAQRNLHECLYHLQSVSYRRTLFEALVVSELTLIVAMPPFHTDRHSQSI